MKTVLVVEDEPAIREMVVEMLRDEGYAVIAAGDGRAALEAVARERPDLVMMDVMMPGMDGREAYRAMRARPDLSEVPVIMMSAAASPDGLDPSISAFVPKPFDLNGMLALVARLLDETASGAPEAAHGGR